MRLSLVGVAAPLSLVGVAAPKLTAFPQDPALLDASLGHGSLCLDAERLAVPQPVVRRAFLIFSSCASSLTLPPTLHPQRINPIGLEAVAWKYYFVFLCTLISESSSSSTSRRRRCRPSQVGLEPVELLSLTLFSHTVYLVLIWFLFVETKGLALEEIALLFDHNKAGTLADKKEAVDAQLKMSNKQIRADMAHIEDKDVKDVESV